MKLTLKPTPLKSTDHLILFIDGSKKVAIPSKLPALITEQLKLIIKNKKAKDLDQKSFHISDGKQNLTINIIDTKAKDLDLKKLMNNGGQISQAATKNKSENISILNLDKDFKFPELSAFIKGFLLGSYKFDHFVSNKKSKQHLYKQVAITTSNTHCSQKDLNELLTIIQSVYYVRDLVNTPPNHLTPKQLTKEAKQIAKLAQRQLKVKVFGEKEMQKLNMGLILGVGSGSQQESQMIFMEYKHKPRNKKPILLVGKGITFDAGGLNIKPTNYIEDMKSDMAGAATVLGIMKLAALLQPELHIIGVIASAENMLGANAMRPGDILTAHNGKTVEITNTDAEGRLVLADALAYSTKKYDPEFVLDMATLTGACIAALGYEYTGVVTNTESLVENLKTASSKSNEAIWPLPLSKLMKEKTKSEIADYKNWTAGVQAGASMGGAFLQNFINKKNWLHFDIAGSSWTPHKTDTANVGATGQPLHLVWEFIKQYC